MSIILGLETATAVCSVALVRDGDLLALRETVTTNGHSALLTAFISEAMAEAGITLPQIDAVAVSIGPGSYTGLRIGVSTAKGLCYSLDKPLIAIETLKAIAWQMQQRIPGVLLHGDLVLRPMIDARRMEVYTAAYDMALKTIEPVDAIVVDRNSFAESANKHTLLGGDGAAKCKPVFAGRQGYLFLDDINASAVAVCNLGEAEYKQGHFADTAYCEPFYFKDFIPGKPRVKGL